MGGCYGDSYTNLLPVENPRSIIKDKIFCWINTIDIEVLVKLWLLNLFEDPWTHGFQKLYLKLYTHNNNLYRKISYLCIVPYKNIYKKITFMIYNDFIKYEDLPTWCRGHKFGLVSPCDPSWFVISICHFRFVYIWLEFDFEVWSYYP